MLRSQDPWHVTLDGPWYTGSQGGNLHRVLDKGVPLSQVRSTYRVPASASPRV